MAATQPLLLLPQLAEVLVESATIPVQMATVILVALEADTVETVMTPQAVQELPGKVLMAEEAWEALLMTAVAVAVLVKQVAMESLEPQLVA
jgi:hypothetical protein